MQEVSGSIPLGSTIFRPHHSHLFFTAVTGEKWWSQAAMYAARQRLEPRRPIQFFPDALFAARTIALKTR
jgi:hypothetical protein